MVLSISVLSVNLGRNLVSSSLHGIQSLDHGSQFSIIGSLAGTSYFGPVAGHGFITHELDEIREERRKSMPASRGTIKGLIEAVPAGESAENFVRVHKKEPEKKEGQEESQDSEKQS